MRFDKNAPTPSLEAIQTQYDEFEAQAIDVWLLLKIIARHCDFDYSWAEITAIPQSEFSLMQSLPALPDLLSKSLGPATFSELPFDLRFAQRENPSDLNNAAAFWQNHKSYASDHIKLSDDVQYFLSLSFIVEQLRKAADVRIEQLRELCGERLTTIEELRSEYEDWGKPEKVSSITNQYEEILDFSEQQAGNYIPFRSEKVLERLSLHFSSIHRLLKKYENAEVSQGGFIFWQNLLGSAFFNPSFIELWPDLSTEIFFEWSEIESNFLSISLKASYAADPVLFREQSRERISEDSLASLSSVLSDYLSRMEEILSNQTSSKNAPEILRRNRLLADEAYHMASIMEEGSENEQDLAPEPSPKKPKHASSLKLKRRIEYAKFLRAMNYSLYTFMNKLTRQNISIPSHISDDYSHAHDYAFQKLRNNFDTIKHLHELVCTFRSFIENECPDEAEFCKQYIAMLSRYNEKCTTDLRALNTSRIKALSRLADKYTILQSDYQQRLLMADEEIEALVRPTWVDFEHGSCRLDSLRDTLERTIEIFEDISGFIASARLTNQSSSTHSDVPFIDQKKIEEWQDALLWLERSRSELTEKLLSSVRVWSDKMRAICAVEDPSLKDFDKVYYLLRLYRKNIRYLEGLFEWLLEVDDGQEVVDCHRMLTSLEDTMARNYFTKMWRSKAIEGFLNRLMTQKKNLKEAVHNLPKVFTCFLNYLEAADQNEINALSLRCKNSLTTVKTLVAEHEAIEEEFIKLSDFFASYSAFAKFSGYRKQFEDSVKILSDNRKLYEKLIIVCESKFDHGPDSEPKNTATLLVLLKNIAEEYHSVDEGFRELLREIDEFEADSRVLTECHDRLLLIFAQGESLFGSLKANFGGKGALYEALNHQPELIKKLGLDLIEDLGAYLAGILDRIERVAETLRPQLGQTENLHI